MWVVLIGVVQGALLAEGQLLAARNVWPVETFTGLIIWFTLVVGLGFSLQLLIRFVATIRFWLVFGTVALVLGGLAWYTGQTIPSPKHASLILRPFAFTTGMGLLIILTVARARLASDGVPTRYHDLFDHALETLFLVALAVWFIATYAIGLLVIGVFVQAWLVATGILSSVYMPVLKATFLYPFAGLFSGMAIALGQSSTHLMPTLRHALLKSCTWSLPVLALAQFGVAITMLAVSQEWMFLPSSFKYSSFKYLVFVWAAVAQVLTLLAINGVYQGGEATEPLPRVTRGSTTIVIILGLLNCMLYLQWLTTTIRGPEWTLGPAWISVFEFLVALTLTGYLIAAVERNRPWMRLVAPVNVAVASVIVVLAGLINTPVLDPKRIVVAYQLHRVLDSARFQPSVLFWSGSYEFFSLGQAGLDAVSRLARVEQHPRAETIRSIAGNALKNLQCGMKPLRGSGAPASTPEGNGRVYLAALDIASIPRVAELARYYQQDLNLSVETLLDVPLFEIADEIGVAWDDDSDQLVAEEAVTLMTRQFAVVADDQDSILIGLTVLDMYIRDSAWRFAFSFRDQDRFAIVSSHRMDPATFRDAPNEELLVRRIRKMITKNIGMLYYRLPESEYRNSVMCGPITDIEDLDLIGERF
ncbi:MAG: hypothetical protein AB1451_14110 [Nitrospirota bacterium]